MGHAPTEAIEGEVVLEAEAWLEDAAVVVALRDVTMADAPAEVVAGVGKRVTGERVRRIPFRLELPHDLPPNRRYSLGAEIRRQGGKEVMAGDYLNVEAIPWPGEPPRRRYEVPVRQI